ncbi:MAG TPA: RcnB family protein [Burkholderiaceae bacterium]
MSHNTKSKAIVSAIAALCMGMNGLAFAQGNDHDRDNHRDDHHAAPARGHAAAPMARGRGAGPDHNFYKGGRLPANYRGHEYVVDDWRGHHLNQPPRGYQWVQVGGDYVMVAIATGIIASLLLNQ